LSDIVKNGKSIGIDIADTFYSIVNNVAYRPSASPAGSLRSNKGGATTALDPGVLQGFSGSSGVLSNAFGYSDILY